jgi:hypothetical protein
MYTYMHAYIRICMHVYIRIHLYTRLSELTVRATADSTRLRNGGHENVFTCVFLRLNGGCPVYLSCNSWKEGLFYHCGRLSVECVEVIRGVGQRRKAFVSGLTAFTQGMEVDDSAALVTDAAALITEHTDEQHQRNDGERLTLTTISLD